MQEVSIEKYVEQVRGGFQYKGYIEIANIKFNYKLKMSVPMNQLDELEPATNIDEIRELFQITLDRNEKEIELSDEEFGFFFSMIVKFAVDFYNNPQTRSSNEGLLEHCLCDEDNPINSTLGTSISIGITSSGLLNFPPDICEMLTAEKFGCKFVC